jgi:hypothetical protein
MMIKGKISARLVGMFVLSMAILFTLCACNGENRIGDSAEESKDEQSDISKNTGSVQGNSNANLANGGIIASQGDWLYYSINNTLYKRKIDGSNKQKLHADFPGNAYWINIIDDWVYFASGGLYKIKTDGSDLQLIDTEYEGGIHIIGDWIYYGTEYKIRTDGSKKTSLYSNNVALAFTLNVVNDWIYFFDKDVDGENAIWKMKTDGSDLQKIHDGRTDYMIVDGDWIYYVDYDDRSLYKMDIDGTSNQLILEGDIANLNITDDWIYYRNLDGIESSLWKIKTDGSGNQLIVTDNAVEICIINDWIYYRINNDHTYTIYRIKSDGSNREDIS